MARRVRGNLHDRPRRFRILVRFGHSAGPRMDQPVVLGESGRRVARVHARGRRRARTRRTCMPPELLQGRAAGSSRAVDRRRDGPAAWRCVAVDAEGIHGVFGIRTGARLHARLCEAICELPEYSITRAEIAILASCAPEIAAMAGENRALRENGSGAGGEGALPARPASCTDRAGTGGHLQRATGVGCRGTGCAVSRLGRSTRMRRLIEATRFAASQTPRSARRNRPGRDWSCEAFLVPAERRPALLRRQRANGPSV